MEDEREMGRCASDNRHLLKVECCKKSGYTKNEFVQSTVAIQINKYAQFKCVPGTLAFVSLTKMTWQYSLEDYLALTVHLIRIVLCPTSD